MNDICLKISNCIDLITICYPKYKQEIIKSKDLTKLSKECLEFIDKHQNIAENNAEIDKYIQNELQRELELRGIN